MLISNSFFQKNIDRQFFLLAIDSLLLCLIDRTFYMFIIDRRSLLMIDTSTVSITL